ncbi:hypothetical protein TPR58_12700 [Sphingomonas sp. HF-S3]|uniref:Uncharacterized protein n=1 Tax=Sphingomonas rustica TaxID=3103142 RepID=A0ABV0B9Y7_9SPHN
MSFLLGLIAAIGVQDAPATQAAPAPAAKAEKKICRSAAPTGSRLKGKSTCHTAAEWREINEANAANASSMGQNNTRSSNTPY